MAAPKALFCPTCRKVVLASTPDFPFCSDRCRILDLGKWASGAYVISSPSTTPISSTSSKACSDRQRTPPPNASDG